MARVLFVASRFPHPPFRGDIVRTLQQIRRLWDRFDVTLVAPQPPPGVSLADAGIEDLCKFIAVRSVGWQRILNLGLFIRDRLPLQTAGFYSASYGGVVAKALSERRFDLVHLQMVRIGPVLDVVGGVPVVLDMIDSASLNMARRAAREVALLRPILRWEAQRLRRYETSLGERCARVVVCSPADRDALAYRDRVRVVPFGIDIQSLPFVEAGREPGLIVLTGRLGYFPNADAAVYFAEQVFPRVKSRVAAARFAIVGIDPPGRVKALRRMPGVEVVPDPNVRTYLERATVAVAPMQSGTGLQIKVLEAMAKGAPIVATRIVSPAIAAEDGRHWFLADSAEGLADRVTFLLENKGPAREMARNARRFVETRFAQDVVVDQMAAIWEEAIASLDEPATRDSPSRVRARRGSTTWIH